MKSLLRKILFVNIFALLALGAYAQDDVNPIQTAMPVQVGWEMPEWLQHRMCIPNTGMLLNMHLAQVRQVLEYHILHG